MYTTFQEAVLTNDEQKLNQVYPFCHNHLTAFCRKFIKDATLAENVASDSILKLLTYPKLSEIEDIKMWLFITARNICFNQLKKLKRSQELSPQHQFSQFVAHTGEENVMADNVGSIIKECLDKREYNIWQLHQEGYHNREIAAMLNSTEKTIANVKTMARKKLKERLKGY